MWPIDTWVGLATLIGVAISGAAAAYWAAHKPSADEQPRSSYAGVAMTIGDSAAFDRIREELRELRATAAVAASNAARANELLDDVKSAIGDVADAIRNAPFPRRRRT